MGQPQPTIETVIHIQQRKHNMWFEFRGELLLLHAMIHVGCDATSAPFNKLKKKHLDCTEKYSVPLSSCNIQ